MMYLYLGDRLADPRRQAKRARLCATVGASA